MSSSKTNRPASKQRPIFLYAVAGMVWLFATEFGAWKFQAVADEKSDAKILKTAAVIDRFIFDAWAQNNVFPAERSTDTEFLRRAWLDVAGRIPPVSVVRSFRADTSKMKRLRAIDELVEGPGYVLNFTNYWQSVLIPEAMDGDPIRFMQLPTFQRWLRRKLLEDAKYDEIAFELLTVTLRGRVDMLRSPAPFYSFKQSAPENLASATARAFLGIRIECAQCHDHPYDTWKREEFWSFAAFFGGFRSSSSPFAVEADSPNPGSIKIPDSAKMARATYLNGELAELPAGKSPRVTLAAWVVSPDNPYFARAAANRIWGYLFGRGIVDPVDDLSDLNTPSHPQLLNTLADILVEQDFDMKFMLKSIMASATYQLSSRRRKNFDAPPELFAIHEVKGMTSQQLYDSLRQAVGTFEPFKDKVKLQRFARPSPSEFLDLFKNNTDPPTETSTTILQALAMMNGTETATATDLKSSKTLTAIVEFPCFSTAQRVEALYYSTLSRPPSEREMDRMLKYVEPSLDWKKALGDVFWALLNSAEFKVNH
jgi:hypothetical protein